MLIVSNIPLLFSAFSPGHQSAVRKWVVVELTVNHAVSFKHAKTLSEAYVVPSYSTGNREPYNSDALPYI